MTQLWNDQGKLVGATIIAGLDTDVVKTGDKTTVAAKVSGRLHKAQQALAEKLGVTKGQKLWQKEFTDLEVSNDKLEVTQFQVGQEVKITGVTKGKGNAGVVKRHGFAGWPATHGHSHQRRPGSIGAQQPQHVPKGQKMAGRMGGEQLTVRGNKVLMIDAKKQLLVVSGAVPGPSQGRVVVVG